MSIGISDEHVELARSLREWAGSLGAPDLVRAAEEDASADFSAAWDASCRMGLPTIGLAEEAGGGDGSALDVAVALEACADSLVPGALLSAAVASRVAPQELGGALAAGQRVALALEPSLAAEGERLLGALDVVLDAPGAAWLLAGTEEDRWFAIPASALRVTPAVGLDLGRRLATVDVDVPLTEALEVAGLSTATVRRTTVTLAAAEASGLARWCLRTAVAYAQVREQFGAKIGSFQAIKHLCAQMLETAEAITAVAWDAADALDGDDEAQAGFAADLAGAVALDGAVRVAQDCIQVLGGIGFTFEHDAHLYLRRAVSLRTLLGPTDDFRAALAQQAAAGARRSVRVDLDGRDSAVRAEVRERVRAIADLPPGERRRALVDAGYLMTHWPAPFGLGADAVTQLVVDQELGEAGVERPDLVIGAWAVPTILAHGTDDQRERFVRPTQLGELDWCQLFSEPGAGSDLASLRTRAERVEGGWRLTGQKVWTSRASSADRGICLARTDPEAPQHRGITYFLVDMRAEGIDIRPLRELTGDAIFSEVFLDGVFVPDGDVVGEPGDGWRLTRTTLASERVAMGSSRLGVSAERAVGLAGDDPVAQVRVGAQVALATVATLLGLRTTLRSVTDAQPGAESTVAKLLGVRARQEASELVVDLLGPRALLGGAEADAAIHEMLLTRCLSIAGGTTQILRNVAAERILGLPR